jgi:hypothetical protein
MIIRALAAAGIALLLLSGCSATTGEPASRAVSEVPRPNSGSVGMQSAALKPVIEAVPPVRVQVPDAGIDVSVTPVGVKADGQMEIPENVDIAGWYRYGPDPASPVGSTVIAAHVDSLEFGLGQFVKLKGLPAGTRIIVSTADGKTHNYLIDSVQNVLKEQLPVGQIFDREGPPRLALITCGGQFDYTSRTYSDNVIVMASPEQP